MNDMFKPSKFHFVKRSTTLRDCIELMQEKKLSFVLVEDRKKKLVGIFTLKDMLKVFKYLIYGLHLDKPVSVAMSQPVLSISANQLHKAPELMTRHRIRHLPVTSEKRDQKSSVIGVVDIESLLFATILEGQKEQQESKDISVYSPNGALVGFLKKILKPYLLLKVDKLWFSKIKTENHLVSHVKSYDLFFADITDQKDLHIVLRLAKQVHRAKKRLIVLVSPKHFNEDSSLNNLQNIAKIPRVMIFEKPINVHDIIFECLA